MLNTRINPLLDSVSSYLTDYFQPRGMKFLSLVGFLYLTYKSFNALHSFTRTFLPIGHDLAHRYRQGSWAVITGGAQGMGAVYADQFAARGFNLILMDFDKEKMKETSLRINTKYPNTQVKTIICDFSDSWKEGFFDSVMNELQDLDISVLVNNVGTGYRLGLFRKYSEDSITKTIAVNILPMTILTRRIIPQMLSRPTRSAIINMASIAGTHPIPVLTVYSGTKAYVDFFSRSLQQEVGFKIDVISVRPSLVSTALTGYPKLSWKVASPENVVNSVLRKLGNVTETHGDWRHEIVGWMLEKPGLNYFMMKGVYKKLEYELSVS